MYVTQSIYFVVWKRKTTDFKENHNANWWECPISVPHCPVVVMVFFWSKPKLFSLLFVLNVGEVNYLTNSLIDMDNISVWFKMRDLSEDKRKTLTTIFFSITIFIFFLIRKSDRVVDQIHSVCLNGQICTGYLLFVCGGRKVWSSYMCLSVLLKSFHRRQCQCIRVRTHLEMGLKMLLYVS